MASLLVVWVGRWSVLTAAAVAVLPTVVCADPGVDAEVLGNGEFSTSEEGVGGCVMASLLAVRWVESASVPD